MRADTFRSSASIEMVIYHGVIVGPYLLQTLHRCPVWCSTPHRPFKRMIYFVQHTVIWMVLLVWSLNSFLFMAIELNGGATHVASHTHTNGNATASHTQNPLFQRRCSISVQRNVSIEREKGRAFVRRLQIESTVCVCGLSSTDFSPYRIVLMGVDLFQCDKRVAMRKGDKPR